MVFFFWENDTFGPKVENDEKIRGKFVVLVCILYVCHMCDMLVVKYHVEESILALFVHCINVVSQKGEIETKMTVVELNQDKINF